MFISPFPSSSLSTPQLPADCPMEKFQTLEIVRSTPNSHVFHLTINRPAFRNALPDEFFTEFPAALAALDENPDVRVIILSGAGGNFCAGIDLNTLFSVMADAQSSGAVDRGRCGEKLRRDIKSFQDAITAIERCRKPVIAAVHGACIGGGIDIITACDLRYCTKDAFFSVKEVDAGLTADLGTLQRLPGIVGYGTAMELSLTARTFSGTEAKEMRLVSRVFGTEQEMEEGVRIVAEGIAAKSPLAVIGTKAVLIRSRDLNMEQGLDYIATWNSSMLISRDLVESISAIKEKRKPVFAKL